MSECVNLSSSNIGGCHDDQTSPRAPPNKVHPLPLTRVAVSPLSVLSSQSDRAIEHCELRESDDSIAHSTRTDLIALWTIETGMEEEWWQESSNFSVSQVVELMNRLRRNAFFFAKCAPNANSSHSNKPFPRSPPPLFRAKQRRNWG